MKTINIFIMRNDYGVKIMEYFLLVKTIFIIYIYK